MLGRGGQRNELRRESGPAVRDRTIPDFGIEAGPDKLVEPASANAMSIQRSIRLALPLLLLAVACSDSGGGGRDVVEDPAPGRRGSEEPHLRRSRPPHVRPARGARVRVPPGAPVVRDLRPSPGREVRLGGVRSTASGSDIGSGGRSGPRRSATASCTTRRSTYSIGYSTDERRQEDARRVQARTQHLGLSPSGGDADASPRSQGSVRPVSVPARADIPTVDDQRAGI